MYSNKTSYNPISLQKMKNIVTASCIQQAHIYVNQFTVPSRVGRSIEAKPQPPQNLT